MRTWVGRVRMQDGSRSPWLDMCTTDANVAEERYQRWLETGEPPSQAGKELFAAAAERILRKMELVKKPKFMSARRQRLRDYALPSMGDIEVYRIESSDVAVVLDNACDKAGKKSGTLNNLRVDISRILSALKREGAVRVNVALGVELPEAAVVDDRPRIVLTDEEVLRFRRRGFEGELDMMALFARDLGGHRTSDLHAAAWEDCDTKLFRTITVRRPKTTDKAGRSLDARRRKERAGARRATRAYEKVLHGIPETVVGPLKAWWEAHGRPTMGPIFPVRKGPRLGQYKGDNLSYAQALRDALWAEGIVRPLPGYETAVGDERRKFCELQVDTDDTRAVDFHSFRRAYVTALANSGLNEQSAMDLTGHTQPTTHALYRGPRQLETPAGALPGGKVSSPSPDSPPPSPHVPPPSAPSDMAAVAAALQALATQLGKQSAPIDPAPEVIDPRFGSKGGFARLRAIVGGKKK